MRSLLWSGDRNTLKKKEKKTMQIFEMKHFEEGRDLWIEYEKLNGYAFRPQKEGLKKLSRLLDLKMAYLEKRINLYLKS
jgi:hypothetical protein